MQSSILTRLLFAPDCWGCKKKAFGASALCLKCWRSLKEQKKTEAGYLLEYRGVAPALLRALRNGGSAWSAGVFLEMLKREKYLDHWIGFASLVIAPSSGNLGLEILCRKLASELAIPFYNPFQKTRGHFQHGKNASDRIDTELFVELASKEKISSPCLIIDDLRTTGTTLDQAAYLLRKRRIDVKTFSLAQLVTVKRFEGESKHSQQEGQEIDPFLLHLFV